MGAGPLRCARLKRIVALLVAVVLAGLLAWTISGGGDDAGERKCADIERLLKAGDLAGAERLLEEARPRLAPRITHYLDSVIAISAGRFDDARRSADAALATGAEAQDDWRVVSLVFFSHVRTGALESGWQALEAYLGRRPDDERALAAAAQYWVEVQADSPDPGRAVEYLDRIDRLAARTVPDSDPTSITPDLIARLRTRAEELRGSVVAAMTAAEARVRATPTDPAAHFRLADACRRAGRSDQAAAAYREAIRLAPADLRVKKEFAKFLLGSTFDVTEVLALTEGLLAAEPLGVESTVLRARALSRDRRNDSAATGDAIELYRGLLRQSDRLTAAERAEVVRNLAVALYDWKAGGRDGEYRDEAYALLVEYTRDIGGKIDAPLQAIWEKLVRHAREKGDVR